MTVAAGDAHEFPIYAGRFRMIFPVFDADGDLVTSLTTPDSERSIDQATFADCSNEATAIATSSGMYYLDLIATEMTCKCLAIIVKSATAGMKTTPMTLHPKRMPTLRSGTAQAGAGSTITLDSGASAKDNAYVGMYVQCSNNSPSNVQGQTRKIISYVGSTKVATVEAAWGTNPSSATTFLILVPETVNVNAWMGVETVDPTTDGVPEVDLTHIAGSAVSTSSAQLGVNVVNAGGTAWASGAITASVIATDAIGSDELAASAVTEIQSGLATSASIAALNNLSAAQVNAEVLDVLTVDTFAQPGQGTPAATATLKDMLAYLFKGWRNKKTQTPTQYSLFNDDAATVDQKATTSDAAGTTTVGEIASGP